MASALRLELEKTGKHDVQIKVKAVIVTSPVRRDPLPRCQAQNNGVQNKK